MASELSHLIESELKLKGYYKHGDIREDDEADEVTDEEVPHQALMGALRVEVRADLDHSEFVIFICPSCYPTSALG